MTRWTGLFPAVTTKLTRDGKVNIQTTTDSIDRLVANGVSGVIVLPMLGENASMTPAEREAIIRGAVEAVAGRVPVLSGLAEVTLDNARANAKLYESYGAQGLMVFPSLGYKTDARETAEWYKGIARASALPIMIYNNPIAYGVDVTVDVLRDLADTPEIVCVKEESGDIRRVTDIRIAHGDRFSVFCGVDDLIVESSALGVTGWVSGMANVWPAECTELFGLCAQNRYPEARALYGILTPSFHLDTHVKLVQYIKLAEHLVYGAPEWTRPSAPAARRRRTRVRCLDRQTGDQSARGTREAMN
ncbi:4-hydroxy-tetrahydrodipicolinate synthase [uncultured bacterium]|nr:4-hydroxy-tetrahydrodipicolinate synthase [uncultured bacterium]